MAQYVVRYRRQREDRTDYKARLKLLVSGKTRLVIRRSNKNIKIQFIDYDKKGDKILSQTNSIELQKKFSWNYSCDNIPSAYLAGYLAGKKAKKEGIKSAIVDLGLQISKRKGVLYSAIKGIIDSGIEIPCNEEVFPEESRIKGEHTKAYSEKLKKEDENKYKKIYSKTLKSSKPENITADFEKTKKMIENGR